MSALFTIADGTSVNLVDQSAADKYPGVSRILALFLLSQSQISPSAEKNPQQGQHVPLENHFSVFRHKYGLLPYFFISQMEKARNFNDAGFCENRRNLGGECHKKCGNGH